MAFSQATLKGVAAVAALAERMYQFAKPKKAFPWLGLGKLILGFLMTNCKPPTPQERQALVRRWAVKLAQDGVAGCCPANLRKKMARRLGMRNEVEQDRAFFTYVMAASAAQDEAVGAMGAAVENGDSDDEDD